MSEGPAPTLTLGIDLGTSAVKIVALTADGTVAAEGHSSFPTNGAAALQAEQNPGDWLRATTEAATQVGKTLAALYGPSWSERIRAIGLTGQLPTLVCLNDVGPVAPAITWNDGRADTWARAKVDSDMRARMYRITGMPIDGRYLAPMRQFHFGTGSVEIRTILSAKDYLLFELTGLRLTEPSTAAGFGIFDLQQDRFSDELSAHWDMPASMLPDIRPSSSLAGPLHAAGAALLGLVPGIPVGVGAADSVCAAFAMSGLNRHGVSISLGSSAVILGAIDRPLLDTQSRYLLTPHVRTGWYGREMDLLASGTGYRWLSQLFGWDGCQIDEHAARSVPGANGLCFAPYLAGGEQGALWNPHLRGAILGLGLQHTREDIARAFLEGVFFEIRRCVDVLAESAPVEHIAISGNIAASADSTQMLADILQRPVQTIQERSPAAIGAALLARPLTGVSEPSGSAAWRMPGVSASASPRHSDYQRLYDHYLLQSQRCV